jgi:hypothetical protein
MSDPRIPHWPWSPTASPYHRPTMSSSVPATAQPDVAQLETTLLAPLPAPLAPSSPSGVPLAAASFPPTPTPTPTPMPEDVRQLHSGLASDPRATQHESEIVAAEREAERARAEAVNLVDLMDTVSASLSGLVTRWRALARRPDRTPAEADELAQLEQTLPARAQRVASLRLKWTALVMQAREQEQRARDLRSRSRNSSSRQERK